MKCLIPNLYQYIELSLSKTTKTAKTAKTAKLTKMAETDNWIRAYHG